MSHDKVTFWVDEHWLGVDVEAVREVIESPALTPVPLADSSVAGLMNLRGQVLLAIDLRQRMWGSTLDTGRRSTTVVLRTETVPVCVVVDSVGDVVTVDADQYAPPPDTLSGPSRAFIRGAFTLANRLLLDLDVSAVVAFDQSKSGTIEQGVLS